MTPRLSTEFKREAHEHLLNTSRQLISSYFDKIQDLEARNCLYEKEKTKSPSKKSYAI